MSWPQRNTGERHYAGGLPEDGTNVDIDGNADYNTLAGRRLDAVDLPEKPEVCQSCGMMVDPLTLGCRC